MRDPSRAAPARSFTPSPEGKAGLSQQARQACVGLLGLAGEPELVVAGGRLVQPVAVGAIGFFPEDITGKVIGDDGRAVDGYSPTITMADLRKYHSIVAMRLNRKPIPLGGLGPLWTVYDADRFTDTAAKKLTERFALCPWALYHIDVLGA